MGISDSGSVRTFRERAGFTLVELMVVMAIVAIVTVAGSAAFKSMGGANVRQKSAVNQAVAVIDQARSQALASGEDHYLVFATDDEDFGELRYRATALYKPNPSTADGKPLVQHTNWQALPQGICFYSPGDSSETKGDLLRGPKEIFSYGDKQVLCPYVQFSSQGAMVIPTVAEVGGSDVMATLYIVQGVYQGSGFTITHKAANGGPVKDAITVSRYTGRVKHLPYIAD